MNTNPNATPDQVAAVDLGSNSFHMIVAEVRAAEPVIVDRLREMVRLGAGLTPQKTLTPEIQQKALACLERFGQRLRTLPQGTVRAVGTNTLRTALNLGPFLAQAEQALGHPIEIISGIEEARLIYEGVAHGLAPDGKRRLVMDIGGGSTEYIIGVDQTPLQKESTHMGCVSMSLSHFGDGKITAKRFKKAVIAAQQELEPHEHLFRKGKWDEAVGASGTLRAVRKIMEARGWSKDGITQGGLNQLVDSVLAAGKIDKNLFPDLNPERHLSFPGGLAIIYGTFKTLGLQHMKVSDKALREGLLYDLLGRFHHDDIRGRTVAALAARYHVDPEHSARVRDTLGKFLGQLSSTGPADLEAATQWLNWAADLHEIGRDIAHSGYHKHGAYILENADLPGFSKQDQFLLATLVRAHRRKYPQKLIKDLAPPWNAVAPPLTLLLRLAILLNRSRIGSALPDIRVVLTETRLDLRFPAGWLDEHPLTTADLEQEAAYLGAAGIELTFL
jgi:exopolyphosphatase/guanosine-5'-triphosphate,3'-diphosphate pyrophosphatase